MADIDGDVPVPVGFEGGIGIKIHGDVPVPVVPLPAMPIITSSSIDAPVVPNARLEFGDNASVPIADSGEDQSAFDTAVVTLDATGSVSESGIESYWWDQVAGTPVTLSARDTSQASFTAPSNGETLTFALTVKDGNGLSRTDMVDVQVSRLGGASGTRHIAVGGARITPADAPAAEGLILHPGNDHTVEITGVTDQDGDAIEGASVRLRLYEIGEQAEVSGMILPLNLVDDGGGRYIGTLSAALDVRHGRHYVFVVSVNTDHVSAQWKTQIEARWRHFN